MGLGNVHWPREHLPQAATCIPSFPIIITARTKFKKIRHTTNYVLTFPHGRAIFVAQWVYILSQIILFWFLKGKFGFAGGYQVFSPSFLGVKIKGARAKWIAGNTLGIAGSVARDSIEPFL